MTHPCTWASEKGRELKLSCPERVTLWQLAERAASRGYCWPSITQLMVDTGLARATVIDVLRSLAAKALIEIEKVGKQGHNYRVLQPVQNKTGDRFRSRPVNGGQPVQNKTGDRSETEPATGSKTASNRFKNATPTGSNLNPNLKENQKRTNGARVEDAPAAAASVREPENDFSSLEKKEGGTPPSMPTTSDSGGDPFSDWLDDGAPADRAIAAATPEPEVLTGEVLPPETVVGANATNAVIRGLGRSMRHFALPGVTPMRTLNEQREQLEDILSPLRPQDPIRTPAQQYAELTGCPLAEAEAKLGAMADA